MSESKHGFLTTLDGLRNCPDAVTGAPCIPKALPGKPEISLEPSLSLSFLFHWAFLFNGSLHYWGSFSKWSEAIFPFILPSILHQAPCHLLLFTSTLSWCVFLHPGSFFNPSCMILPRICLIKLVLSLKRSSLPFYLFAIHLTYLEAVHP